MQVFRMLQMSHALLENRRQLLIKTLTALSLILLLAEAMLAYRGWRRLGEAYVSMAHTQEVKHAVQDVATVIDDAQTGQRGFLLAGKPIFLKPWEDAERVVGAKVERMTKLVADNPEQTANAKTLSDLITVLREHLSRTIGLAQTGKKQEALAIFMTEKGRITMFAIRDQVAKMHAEEDRLLAIRSAAASDARTFNERLAALFVVLDGLIIWVLLFFARRLHRLQNLVTVCGSSHMIKDGDEWLKLEDYLVRRFGVEVSHGISDEAAMKMRTEMAAARVERLRVEQERATASDTREAELEWHMTGR